MPFDRDPGVVTVQEQAQASGLTGVLWEVVSLGNAPPAPATMLTAQFSDDGTLTGSDGCNSYSASFVVDGASITIEPGISTTMACPELTMAQASSYVAALAAAATYALDGEMMTLSDADGTIILTYRAIEQGLAGASGKPFSLTPAPLLSV